MVCSALTLGASLLLKLRISMRAQLCAVVATLFILPVARPEMPSGTEVYNCRGIDSVSTRFDTADKRDLNYPWLRCEVRTVSYPVVITFGPKNVEYRRADLKPLYGPGSVTVVIRSNVGTRSGTKFWSQMTESFPEGFVEYRFDGLRGVMLEIFHEFSYERGVAPPDDSIKSEIRVTAYKCEALH
jgi:hypothetical protein